MQLYRYHAPNRNFGDDLNDWLWPRVAPGLIDGAPGELWLGIGTILNKKVPQKPRKVVFGSGAGYGDPPNLDHRWDVLCVRGPMTAGMLDLDMDMVATDAAALVATVVDSEGPGQGPPAFMPHHSSAAWAPWRRIAARSGLRYIDPRWGVERVLGAIKSTRLLVTEAMHGAIIADTLRVPWAPVRLHKHILDLKWQGWTASLGLPYDPLRPTHELGVWRGVTPRIRNKLWPRVVGPAFLRRAAAAPGFLSSQTHFDRALGKLTHALDAFLGERGLVRQGHVRDIPMRR